MTDFYGIARGAHPDFVRWNDGLARWDDLPPHEQALFFEGVERPRGLHCTMGEETFGRVLRFVASEEEGVLLSPEAWIDPDLIPELR